MLINFFSYWGALDTWFYYWYVCVCVCIWEGCKWGAHKKVTPTLTIMVSESVLQTNAPWWSIIVLLITIILSFKISLFSTRLSFHNSLLFFFFLSSIFLSVLFNLLTAFFFTSRLILRRLVYLPCSQMHSFAVFSLLFSSCVHVLYHCLCPFVLVSDFENLGDCFCATIVILFSHLPSPSELSSLQHSTF